MIHVVFQYLDTHPTHAGIRTRTCFTSQGHLNEFLAGGHLLRAQEKIIYSGEDEEEAKRLIDETFHLAFAHHFQEQMDMVEQSDLPAADKLDMMQSIIAGHKIALESIENER